MTEKQRIEAATQSWERFGEADPLFFMNFNDFYLIFCEGIRAYVEHKEKERIARKSEKIKKQFEFLKRHGMVRDDD